MTKSVIRLKFFHKSTKKGLGEIYVCDNLKAYRLTDFNIKIFVGCFMRHNSTILNILKIITGIYRDRIRL